jgi:hypothetical protein
LFIPSDGVVGYIECPSAAGYPEGGSPVGLAEKMLDLHRLQAAMGGSDLCRTSLHLLQEAILPDAALAVRCTHNKRWGEEVIDHSLFQDYARWDAIRLVGGMSGSEYLVADSKRLDRGKNPSLLLTCQLV